MGALVSFLWDIAAIGSSYRLISINIYVDHVEMFKGFVKGKEGLR